MVAPLHYRIRPGALGLVFTGCRRLVQKLVRSGDRNVIPNPAVKTRIWITMNVYALGLLVSGLSLD